MLIAIFLFRWLRYRLNRLILKAKWRSLWRHVWRHHILTNLNNAKIISQIPSSSNLLLKNRVFKLRGSQRLMFINPRWRPKYGFRLHAFLWCFLLKDLDYTCFVLFPLSDRTTPPSWWTKCRCKSSRFSELLVISFLRTYNSNALSHFRQRCEKDCGSPCTRKPANHRPLQPLVSKFYC